MKKHQYVFQGKLWMYPGETGNWHFVSLPKAVASLIETAHTQKKRGWGSLKVRATVGKTTWETSIFPDKRSGTYLLPVKASVRSKELFQAEEEREVSLVIV